MSRPSAPELADYQDEPKQLPSGSLGKNAALKLGFERRSDRTILATLHRKAPLIVQQALYYDEEMPDLPCVQIITNSGGILQGDRYAIDITLGAAAQAHVTTQAATRIHEMDTNYAAQTQRITVAAGAYLEYLPHPVIPFRNARFITETNIIVDPTATIIYSEVLMPGRKYYGAGERFDYDVFSSTVRAGRADGNPLFVEKFVIEPKRSDVRAVGVMGSFDVFANVLVLAPAEIGEKVLGETPVTIDLKGGTAASAGRLPAGVGIFYKVLGMESQPVRAVLRDFWSVVRRTAVGASVPREFLWG
jgi:urease accessory protein